ncbi:replicative DNA helicase [Lentzea sp. NBRC 102530]|uniref:replicative DNA helicase n=1 Tax=Lentzea sp. NBRC 102530 TaxID=3032201 RepID=UPI0024A3159F|nr:replicative DNA helicase [Lentzea sp. NBRC 102530]GLY54895.1 replicative DNA helicase [Lentzea sp. NBRC 102530]
MTMPNGKALLDPDDSLTPPFDVRAEQTVLSAMLLAPDEISAVSQVLREQDFYRPPHTAIYRAILDLHQHGHPTDPVAVSAELERRGELDRVGGAPYLHTLYAVPSTAANAAYYAEIVAEKSVLRSMGEVGTRMTQRGYGNLQGEDVDDVLEKMRADLDAVIERRVSRSGWIPTPALAAGLEHHLAQLDVSDHDVLSTGLPDLDRLLKIRPGELIFVAARPSVGKTLLGLRFARQVAFRHRRTALVVSLEMSELELTARILAAEANVEMAKLLPDVHRPELTERDLRKLTECYTDLADAPLLLDVAESASYTADTLRARLRQLQRQDMLPALVVVDYLGLMQHPAAERNDLALGETGRRLKLTAREFGVPIIAIHQMNREVEKRQDKRPLMSDLHNSGALEQHANAILFLVPELSDDGVETGVVTLHIGKNRSGPKNGTVSLLARGHVGDIASYSDAA